MGPSQEKRDQAPALCFGCCLCEQRHRKESSAAPTKNVLRAEPKIRSPLWNCCYRSYRPQHARRSGTHTACWLESSEGRVSEVLKEGLGAWADAVFYRASASTFWWLFWSGCQSVSPKLTDPRSAPVCPRSPMDMNSSKADFSMGPHRTIT